MKKILILTAVAVIGMSANAQITFGTKAGYSLSTIKVEGSTLGNDFDPKSTFYIGGLAEYKINDKFAVQGELLYSTLGGKTSGNFSIADTGVSVIGNQETDLRFSTIQIPISGKFYATENLAFGLGLNVGIVAAAKSKIKGTFSATSNGQTVSSPVDETIDVGDDFKSLNLAPFVGVEYNLKNGLFFDARYNLGVSNLVKDAEGDESLKNSFLQVGVGFKFGGK